MDDNKKKKKELDKIGSKGGLVLKTKLGVLVDYYNEEIIAVTRLETDIDALRSLELSNPKDTTYVTKRTSTEAVLMERSRRLRIITEKILNIDKEGNGEKN